MIYCIKNRCKWYEDGESLYFIDEIVRKVIVNMHSHEEKDDIWIGHWDYI